MFCRMTAAVAAFLSLAAGATAQGTKPDVKSEARPDAKQPAKPDPKLRKDEPITLNLGDKAPALSVEEWIKGDKVESFQAGHIYVVEFWATWCRPCRESIAHLSKLQTTYKDKGVTIIGIAGSEDERTKVPPEERLPHLKKFVQDRGDALAYTVAFDQDRSMARDWMRPAGQDTIPCAFVIDGDGKIAWVGHPMNGLDSALKALLNKPAKPAKGDKSDKGGKPDSKPKKSPKASAGDPAITLAAQPRTKERPQNKVQPKQPDRPRSPKPPADPPADEVTLRIGDAAPPITVAKWLKGEHVEQFQKGKTYIVEFWATWSSACIEAIPRLTEVQKAHKDVSVLSICTWEFDPTKAEAFVAQREGDIGYAVALDEPQGPAPKGENGEKGPGSTEGRMATAWLTAAGYSEIPTIFIVGPDGKIAWIGGPGDENGAMEKVLSQVLAGKWDLARAAAADRNRTALKPLYREYMAAKRADDADAQLAAIDKILAIDPSAYDPTVNGAAPLIATRFNLLLLDKKDPDAAYAYAAQAIDGIAKDKPAALNNIAWTIVDPQGPEISRRDLKLALKAATRADELLEHKDAAVLDTLAKVYHDQGDLPKAMEIQEKAAALSVGTPFEKEITSRLEQYKDEAAKKGG